MNVSLMNINILEIVFSLYETITRITHANLIYIIVDYISRLTRWTSAVIALSFLILNVK